jgi:hypothetical protein
MFAQCKKLIAPVCLLLGLGSVCGEAMAAKSNPQVPLRTIAVSVEKNARDAFFEQLKKFADRHAFAIRVAPVRPDGEHFIVQMWREDIKGIGVNPFDPAGFEISFYENDCVHPVPAAHVDVLINDLKLFIGAIQGVTIPKPTKK